MLTEISLVSALVLGLLGSTHCVGMCGGISAALSLTGAQQTVARSRWLVVLCYNLGRLLSYAAMGAGFGFLSNLLVSQFAPFLSMFRIFAGILLILMGLYLAGWSKLLARIESVGTVIWRAAQKAGSVVVVDNQFIRAILMGAVWGWLPCGLIYSTLGWAASSADPLKSALLMLAFGAGTLPALFTTGMLAHRLASIAQVQAIRKVSGSLIILFGVWTLLAVFALSHDEHQSHGQLPEHTPKNHATHHN